MSAKDRAGVIQAGLAEYMETANLAGRASIGEIARDGDLPALQSGICLLNEGIKIDSFRRGEILKIHVQRITQW